MVLRGAGLTNSFCLPSVPFSFAFVPVHLRMPYIATLSFGYVCLLSFTRGKLSTDCEADSDAPVQEEVGQTLNVLAGREAVCSEVRSIDNH